MRIAIGQLWQETNTFNPLPTTRADFEAFGVLRGPALLEKLADTNEPGGFIQSLRAWPERPEIVGLVRLPAWPGGAATADTFAWLLHEMLAALDAAGPVDAVLLALHGALVSETEPDVEGAVLEAVRRRIGPQLPLVVTLDLHASVTRRMIQAADAVVLYHTAPHIDVFETGQRGAAVLRRILIDGVRPATAFQRVPMVVPADRANTQDPASVSFALCRRLRELEKEPGVLAAGLATVQPWLDIPDMGSAVVVVAEDEQRARAACRDRRGTLAEATGLSVGAGRGGGGGRARPRLHGRAGGAERLRRRHHVGSAGRQHAHSAATAASRLAATGAGDDGRSRPCGVPGRGPPWLNLVGPLGGKRDHRFSTPLDVTMRLLRRFEARFVLSGHLAHNLAIDMGPAVVLAAGNVHVVVTAQSGPHFAPELFFAGGLDPFAASVFVAKSPCGFRAAFQDRAALILVVRAPGCAGRLLELRLPPHSSPPLAVGRVRVATGPGGISV